MHKCDIDPQETCLALRLALPCTRESNLTLPACWMIFSRSLKWLWLWNSTATWQPCTIGQNTRSKGQTFWVMHEILTKIRFSPSVPMIGDAYSEREHEHIYIGIPLNTTACTDLRACGRALYAGLPQRALNMCTHVLNAWLCQFGARLQTAVIWFLWKIWLQVISQDLSLSLCRALTIVNLITNQHSFASSLGDEDVTRIEQIIMIKSII